MSTVIEINCSKIVNFKVTLQPYDLAQLILITVDIPELQGKIN